MREEQPESSMEKQASRSMVDLLTLPDEAQTINHMVDAPR